MTRTVHLADLIPAHDKRPHYSLLKAVHDGPLDMDGASWNRLPVGVDDGGKPVDLELGEDGRWFITGGTHDERMRLVTSLIAQAAARGYGIHTVGGDVWIDPDMIAHDDDDETWESPAQSETALLNACFGFVPFQNTWPDLDPYEQSVIASARVVDDMNERITTLALMGPTLVDMLDTGRGRKSLDMVPGQDQPRLVVVFYWGTLPDVVAKRLKQMMEAGRGHRWYFLVVDPFSLDVSDFDGGLFLRSGEPDFREGVVRIEVKGRDEVTEARIVTDAVDDMVDAHMYLDALPVYPTEDADVIDWNEQQAPIAPTSVKPVSPEGLRELREAAKSAASEPTAPEDPES